jgi:hypothetical protein
LKHLLSLRTRTKNTKNKTLQTMCQPTYAKSVLHKALLRFFVRVIAAALQWQRARCGGRMGGCTAARAE